MSELAAETGAIDGTAAAAAPGTAGSDAAAPAAGVAGGVGPWVAAFAVFKRELGGYFATPVAYVFMVIFLVLSGVFTFAPGLGSFFRRDQAGLEQSFFAWLPWLYLFLIPALSMRVWAEERRGGTAELLLTLPVPSWAAVVGKFLAVWAFAAIALGLTAPLWVTVNVLGDPDNGVIAASYIGGVLMAGGFLAIGVAASAATKSQVIAFVVSVVVSFVFLLIGYDVLLGWLKGFAPAGVVSALSSLSFLSNFEAIAKGVLELKSVVFFLSVIAAGLAVNAVLVEANKAR